MQNTLLKNRIMKSIRIFYRNDFLLIENEVNERSITHKLAEYLQQEFPEYNVDCEYNRMPGNNGCIPKRLSQNIEQISSDDIKATTVYPDIIIHRRGFNNDNLLVIEVKKYTNRDKDALAFDIKKISAYIAELKYEHGLFLMLYKTPEETLRSLDWYLKK